MQLTTLKQVKTSPTTKRADQKALDAQLLDSRTWTNPPIEANWVYQDKVCLRLLLDDAAGLAAVLMAKNFQTDDGTMNPAHRSIVSKSIDSVIDYYLQSNF